MGDSLMTATVVVILDVIPDASSEARHVILWVDVDVLGLDGTPEPLYPDVVLAAATPVHADLDAMLLTRREPQLARVLATLVGVDNLWRTMSLNGHLQHLDAVLLVQRIVQSPGHDTATVDIDDGREVHEAVQHRYIGNVYAPHLVGAGDLHASQQIRHPVLRFAELREVLLRIYRSDAHLAHQPAHPLWPDEEAQQTQMVYHTLHTSRRMLSVLLVYLLHQRQVLITLALGLVVVRPLADAEKLQLAVHAERMLRGYQSSAGIGIPNAFDARFAKSSFISNSPIFRR